MEVKPGYKQTEVGVIPEDWEVRPLGEAVAFLDGRRRPVKDADRAKMRGTIPYYGASGIVDYVNDHLFDEDLVLLGEDGENILSRNCRLAFRISGKAWVNNHAHVLKPNPDISIGFLTDFLESLNYEQYNSGTAQPKLNKQTCYRIPVALPPTKAEQEAIAETLSDADALIESLEQLVAKKRQVKHGAMQELLTGQKRIPGFTGEWEWKEIRGLLSVLMDFRGRTPKKLGMDWGGGDIRALSAGNVKMGRIDFTEETYFGSDDLYRKWMTQGDTRRGDVLMTTEAPLGNVAQIPDDNKYILSQRIILLRTDPELMDRTFLFHVLCSNRFQGLLKKDSSGTTATGIQRLKFERIKVSYPQIAEQSAIASILSDMDAEVAALEAKLAKTRQVKQGMMQHLLTGKVRLHGKAGEVVA